MHSLQYALLHLLLGYCWGCTFQFKLLLQAHTLQYTLWRKWWEIKGKNKEIVIQVLYDIPQWTFHIWIILFILFYFYCVSRKCFCWPINRLLNTRYFFLREYFHIKSKLKKCFPIFSACLLGALEKNLTKYLFRIFDVYSVHKGEFDDILYARF